MPYKTNIPGWMREPELKAIERIAKGLPLNGQMAEIGSFLGRSAVAWAASAPTTIVHCIDTWSQDGTGWFETQESDPPFGDHSLFNGWYKSSFIANTAEYDNIRPHQGHSQSEKWEHFKDLDLVFLDGDHSYRIATTDIAFWLPKLKPDGLLCGHDFTIQPRLRGVPVAVLEHAYYEGLNVFIPQHTAIWMLIRDADHHQRWWWGN